MFNTTKKIRTNWKPDKIGAIGSHCLIIQWKQHSLNHNKRWKSGKLKNLHVKHFRMETKRAHRYDCGWNRWKLQLNQPQLSNGTYEIQVPIISKRAAFSFRFDELLVFFFTRKNNNNCHVQTMSLALPWTQIIKWRHVNGLIFRNNFMRQQLTNSMEYRLIVWASCVAPEKIHIFGSLFMMCNIFLALEKTKYERTFFERTIQPCNNKWTTETLILPIIHIFFHADGGLLHLLLKLFLIHKKFLKFSIFNWSESLLTFWINCVGLFWKMVNLYACFHLLRFQLWWCPFVRLNESFLVDCLVLAPHIAIYCLAYFVSCVSISFINLNRDMLALYAIWLLHIQI